MPYVRFITIYRYSHNIYVEGLLFSRPWVCRDRIAGIELFRPPRGTRDSVIIIIVIILYLALKLIHWLVLILCSWAVYFIWNPTITTQRYYIQKSNIRHWDRNYIAHLKPSKLDAQRSYRDVTFFSGSLSTSSNFPASSQASKSFILMCV